MRFIANYIMRGRLASVLVTSVFALLSLILPPLIHLSGAAVALVSLRKGLSEGLILALASALVCSGFASAVLGTPMAGAVFAVVVWLPMVLLGEVLRRSVSLPVTLSLVAIMATVVIVLFQLAVDDPAQWWQHYLSQLTEGVMAQASAGHNWQASIAAIAQVMTGILAAAMALSLVTNLLIARWWQAMLYNEGGFRREFYALRLQRSLVWALVVLAGIGLIGGVAGQLAVNILLVLLLLFLLQATAVVHAVVAAKQASSAWLLVFYVALFIFPQVAALLVLVGISDSWVDYRRRMGRQGDDNQA